jgi:hypothetical protein
MRLETVLDAAYAQMGPGWRMIVDNAPTVHLAILREPYLEWILRGTKTIESRFSVNRVLPFERVLPGDVVLLKRSGGPIVGAFSAGVVFTSERVGRDAKEWLFGFRQWNSGICVDDSFWMDRLNKRYATLIWIDQLCTLDPITIDSRGGDRRAWIILRERGQEDLFRTPAGEGG